MARAPLPVKINSVQLLQRSTSVVPMLRGRCRHAAPRRSHYRTPDPPPLTTDGTVALGSRAGDEPVHTCTYTHSTDTHTHARPLSRHVRVHASHVQAHDMRARSGARVAWTVTCGTGGLTSRHGWIEGLGCRHVPVTIQYSLPSTPRVRSVGPTHNDGPGRWHLRRTRTRNAPDIIHI